MDVRAVRQTTFSIHTLSSSNIQGFKRPKKENHESSIYNCGATRVADPGDGTEQLRPPVQSADELARARSGQETDRGKGILSQVLRGPEKPLDQAPEAGRPVCL